MIHILIAEDDPSIARFLDQALQESGYTTDVVGDGLEALQKAKVCDALVLDVMLPGLSGLDVCRRMRSDGLDTPVLMVTARDTLDDKVAGLDSGADDYLVKPFQLAELLARVRAVLRRRPTTNPRLLVADLALDPATRRATRGALTVSLSATEYTLLEVLMTHAHQVVPRDTLLDHVWGYDFGGNANVLEVYINYLRNKLDRDRPIIHTVRRVGYMLGP